MCIIPALVPLTLALEIASVILSTLVVLLIFTGFVGIMSKRLHAKSELYLGCNAIGSFFLFVSLLISSITGRLAAIPICVFQVIWGGMSGYKWRKVRFVKRGVILSKFSRMSLADPNSAFYGEAGDTTLVSTTT